MRGTFGASGTIAILVLLTCSAAPATAGSVTIQQMTSTVKTDDGSGIKLDGLIARARQRLDEKAASAARGRAEQNAQGQAGAHIQ